MTTDNDHEAHDPQPNDPDELAALFRHVRAREQPPQEAERAIREAVYGTWRQTATASRRRGAVFAFAVAASVALALIAVLFRSDDPTPAGPVLMLARVERAIGDVRQSPAGRDSVPVETGDNLASATRLATAAGAGLALRWTDGTMIRVDAESEVRLELGTEIRLLRGAIYVDTGQAGSAAGAPVVMTPQGEVRHTGTRYMTRVSSAGTTVSVRSGAVAFRGEPRDARPRLEAGAGEQLTAPRSGAPRVEPALTWGSEWAWTESLSPGFVADGRSLAELFDWVAVETGRAVSYASSEARGLAERSLLHGSFELPPMRTLAVASATSDLIASADGGEIRVTLRDP